MLLLGLPLWTCRGLDSAQKVCLILGLLFYRFCRLIELQDLLIAVNSTSMKTINTKQAAKLLAGEKGTKVKLTLLKGNEGGTKFTVSLTRQLREDYENAKDARAQRGN